MWLKLCVISQSHKQLLELAVRSFAARLYHGAFTLAAVSLLIVRQHCASLGVITDYGENFG